jgi:hypothetical protein
MLNYAISGFMFLQLALTPVGGLFGSHDRDCPRGSRDCFPKDRVGWVRPFNT